MVHHVLSSFPLSNGFDGTIEKWNIFVGRKCELAMMLIYVYSQFVYNDLSIIWNAIFLIHKIDWKSKTLKTIKIPIFKWSDCFILLLHFFNSIWIWIDYNLANEFADLSTNLALSIESIFPAHLPKCNRLQMTEKQKPTEFSKINAKFCDAMLWNVNNVLYIFWYGNQINLRQSSVFK